MTMLPEIRVVLLLFSIGIEFSVTKLGRVKRAVGLGPVVQVGRTVAAVAGIGVLLSVEVGPTLSTGALIALSSTAVVLGVLVDRGETDTPSGHFSLAIAMFEDLAIVTTVPATPVMTGVGGNALGVIAALGPGPPVINIAIVGARLRMTDR